MIQQLDAHKLSGLRQSFGDLNVLRTRRRITARMIMQADDGSRASLDGGTEDLPRMNDRGVKAADKDRFLADDLVF